VLGVAVEDIIEIPLESPGWVLHDECDIIITVDVVLFCEVVVVFLKLALQDIKIGRWYR